MIGTALGATQTFDGELAPIAHTHLFVTDEAEALVLREAPSGTVVQRFEDTSAHAVAADGSVVLVAVPGALVAYDTSTRAIRQRIALAPGTSAHWLHLDSSGTAVTAMQSGDDKENQTVVTYDLRTGQALLTHPYDGLGGRPQPAFSPDGQTMAAIDDQEIQHRYGVKLVDRATQKTLATSTDWIGPTSFAFSATGKYLAVGGPRAACIFAVPGLRLVATTPTLRPPMRDDDAQDTDVQVADNLLYAATIDGTVGVFTVPGGQTLFIERGFLVHMAGKLRVVTESHEVLAVAANGAVSRRPLTTAERARNTGPYALDDSQTPSDPAAFLRIGPHVCRIHEWLLPRAACDL